LEIDADNEQEKDKDRIKRDVKEAQNFLADSNVAELIIQTLKNATDLKLICSILQFGIALTLDGNSKCQNAILNKLKEDEKN
jgi:hypothetical protein